jgi:hypothetical protein
VVIPTTQYSLGVFLVLVLPGIVYAAVRTGAAGMRAPDRDVSARVLQALLVSVLLDVLYLLILGDWVLDLFDRSDKQGLGHPRQAALTLLVLGIAVPAAVAYAAHGQLTSVPVASWLPAWVRRPQRSSPHRSIPTAWDFAAPSRGGRWVRIRMAEGKWVGGWIGNDSYVSTYPEPRDIFIEDQHDISAAGVIGAQIKDTAGVWVALREGDLVEWLYPDS